ncbi:hypothetical protein Slin15195_G087240 [Septoria linicola]|uniref:GDS1 winged helix domain-containing protein n=1 Tax=Septoria linicola TaxID=215465 RepID=A0A9Q9AZJ7_9PEZI|nr:hypothetical protein Slin14017_G089830 [Septoria linicola]USW55405.1 hypothetical protein Slin15195_G087240 [Septoria linicola]
MQTRRKSLNLGDLGIVSAKRAPETLVEDHAHPIKKPKRSHGSASPPVGLMSPPRTTTIRFKDEPRKRATELSPPPSPVAEGSTKVDTEGINDDIVVGTIQQIEKTGNRPHLVKELAAVLATKLHCVEKSANPSALISSRLTAYLHRTWPTVSPCPLAKDLSPVHPRRLYFYLTTTQHQPIPDTVEQMPKAVRTISPSISSASAADIDDRFTRERQSLSPEVDLSSPELDEDTGADPRAPGGSYSARSSISRERASFAHTRRNASPPLETEERDFKQTASALYEEAQKRRNSQHSQQDTNMDSKDASPGAEDTGTVAMSVEEDETEESVAMKNSAFAIELFGASVPSQHGMDLSSPVLGAQNDHPMGRHDEHMRLNLSGKEHHITLPEAALGWDSLQSPEDIELSELDDMLDAY